VTSASLHVEMAPGDWAVLGAIAEGPIHGFAIAQLLAADGGLGRIWTVPRPVVYQVIKKLEQLGLVAEQSTERSDRGPARTIVTVTPTGRREIRRWLTEPVGHVRDVRSLLMLKLALLDRSNGDRRPLVDAQRDRLLPLVASLERQRDNSDGFDRVLAEWRLSSSQATLHFLDAIAAASPAR
jgi:DNA-binding PadR family transcriptional regulator